SEGIAGSNTAPISKRKIGENKLLSSKNRYTPYASSSSSSSRPNQPPHSLIGRCLTCKANVARPSAKYCQPCAWTLCDVWQNGNRRNIFPTMQQININSIRIVF
ncbi:hypothetical protein PSHT_14440, partial [Puccinia striiformis]